MIWLKETDSVLEYVKARAAEGLKHWTCVCAERQTAGRGRLGRAWLSPEGGVYLAILIRPRRSISGLSLAMALWTSDFIESQIGARCEIMWPNDLYCYGKKLCGILLEGASAGDGDRYIAAGIGINLNSRVKDEGRNPEGLNPVSISEITGKTTNREHFAEDLSEQLRFCYEGFERNGFEPYRIPILEKCPMIGKKVEITENGEKRTAVAKGIGPDGELITERNGEPESVWNCDRIRIV